MNIHEFQAKEVFGRFGIPIPPGRVAMSADEAFAIATEYGVPCVVKAQVHTGGRGKAGGIKIARSPEEARAAAEATRGQKVAGVETEIAAERQAAMAELDAERAAALGQLSGDVADLAVAAASKVVQAPLDAASHRSTVDDYVNRSGGPR